jgi:N-acetylmuramoyl-L-alanine amidase CwlA
MGVVFHNSATTLSAIREASGMQGNLNSWVGFHAVADEKEVVQCLPLDRTAYHAGDGTGSKSYNRTFWGVEVRSGAPPASAAEAALSASGFSQAERNAAYFIAKLFLAKGIQPNTKTVMFHQEIVATRCPWRTVEVVDGGNRAKSKQRIINLIAAYMAEIKAGGTERMKMSTSPVAMQLGPMSTGDMGTMKALLDKLKIGYVEKGGYLETVKISVGDQDTVLQKASSLSIGFGPLTTQVDMDKYVLRTDYDAMAKHAGEAEQAANKAQGDLANIKDQLRQLAG